ncbi:MAG: hypothetical protein M3O98_03030 [Actinomycetota bacterium]|nr:hypothetical protein [Actinomycetota bacterium]
MIGAAIALTLIPFTPPGVPIVAAGAACLLGLSGGARLGRRREREDGGPEPGAVR